MRKPTPKIIYKYLDAFVIGQEDAKRSLSNVFFLHMMRGLYCMRNPSDVIKKSNILLMGPTGTGKTLLVETLERFSDLPLLHINAKDIAQHGWKGCSIDEHLYRFLKEVKDIKLVEHGIIFIDEFDKLCMPNYSSHGDDNNKIIQHSLLKSVEGMKVLTGKYKIDTSRMLFVLAGNFEHLRENRQRRLSVVGFATKEQIKEKELLPHEELIEAGMIPEFAGRISMVAELKPLTKAQLKKAFTGVENNILSQYQKLFDFMGEKLTIPTKEINKIVNTCFDNGIGARGLQTALDRYLKSRISKIKLDAWDLVDY